MLVIGVAMVLSLIFLPGVVQEEAVMTVHPLVNPLHPLLLIMLVTGGHLVVLLTLLLPKTPPSNAAVLVLGAQRLPLWVLPILRTLGPRAAGSSHLVHLKNVPPALGSEVFEAVPLAKPQALPKKTTGDGHGQEIVLRVSWLSKVCPMYS